MIDEQRNNIIKPFSWLTTPKINFGNDKLNRATMTNYESKTIQNILLMRVSEVLQVWFLEESIL